MSSMQVKPFLKWAGGKYSCLNQLLSSFPDAKRLIEPFTGSGAVFVNTQYQNYLLAEANPDLVLLYQQLQSQGIDFINHCERFFTDKNNSAESYYSLREKFNNCNNQLDRAAIFLYLNRHGYNGLCRYNQKGGYNVPFGRYTKPYFPKKELLHFQEKSQNAEFILSDFKQTFALAQSGDLIYCDPPYVPLSKSSSFTSYTKNRFKEEDQIILADLAKQSTKKGITVIISNHDNEFTRKHYQGAVIKSFPVRRNINCKKNRRGPVKELIAIFQ